MHEERLYDRAMRFASLEDREKAPMTEMLQIEKMSYGPDAVAHEASGRTVFVQGAVPGDVAEVRIGSEHKSFAKGCVERIVEASPFRVSPKDPELAGSVEPWSMIAYAEQLRAKRMNVVEALVRNGGIPREEAERIVEEVRPSKREYGYRNKLEMAAFSDEAGRFQLGFREHGSDDPIIAKRCSLAVRSIERAPKALAGAIRYMSGAEDLGIHRVGVRASLRTKSIEVALWTPPSAFPRTFAAKMLEDALGATSVVRVIAEPGSERKVKRVEALAGRGFWLEEICGLSFSVSAPSFFQVNTAQAEVLVKLACEMAAPEEGMLVADVFAGVGTFSLPLASAGADVVAIELSGSAVRDLRRNADANGLFVDAICDDAVRALDQLEGAEVILVDPPRSGLDERVTAGICEAGASRIVYVSCDPQTLSRDVARMASRGYRLCRVCPVDLFPQTYHVETVNLFERVLA